VRPGWKLTEGRETGLEPYHGFFAKKLACLFWRGRHNFDGRLPADGLGLRLAARINRAAMGSLDFALELQSQELWFRVSRSLVQSQQL
jgi:hypothetical protein